MKDCRKYLLRALISSINGLSTGLIVYSKVPRGDSNNVVQFPYMYITEITDSENGPKNEFHYEYSVTIEIVYAGLNDRTTIWDMADKVKGIINNNVPFLLGGGFEIMQATIGTTNEREDLLGSTDVDVMSININFLIEDNN